LAANVKKVFELSCAFNVQGEIPQLPEHTTTQLYKIAQEAVSNAIKHGKAARVTIHLTREDSRLLMSIKNDGVPFAAASHTKNRMGLRIMNFRANTIGAFLEIGPNGKSGTVVTCSVPLKNGTRSSRRDPESNKRLPKGGVGQLQTS
jgi:signal transduction histidine kinase